jgi:hypothetical protein
MNCQNAYRAFTGILIMLIVGVAQLSYGRQSPPPANTLATQTKSLDTGKVLFEDHFSGNGKLTENRFAASGKSKWPVMSGNWSVKNGVLTAINEGDATTEAYILAGDCTWTNYCITGEVRPDKHSKIDNAAGILVRVNSDEPFGSRYTISLNGYKNWVGCANDRGPKQWIGHGKFRFAPNRWYSFAVAVHDSGLEVSVNGRSLFSCNHLLLTHGKIGLEAWNRGTQQFRDIKVTRID